MKYHDKTNDQLFNEAGELQQHIEDLGTEAAKRNRSQRALKVSETRYRRLFETAQDGILLLNADTGQILDVNPFLLKMLGYSHKNFLGKKLWEIGPFSDSAASRLRFSELQTKGYVRYEHLPLETKDGRLIAVEFVSNVYLVGYKKIIQCNIRDITLRKRAEEALRKAYDEMGLRVKERTAELKGVVETLQNEMSERKQGEEKLKITNALLSLFSRKPSRKDYLDAVVDLVHSWSGCRCVGIRILNDEGYISHESYVGFTREFWESENRLSIEHAQCVCMRVVTGNPDPQDVSMMTPGGSFHCDDTVAFIGCLSAEEKARFRGVCIQNGFLSLNVVPIRYGNKVLGTIHLADEQRKKLSLSFIEFLELMSPLIGEAINHFNLEDELRESESRFRFLSSQLLTVQEDERKRISAELHDDIAAKLAGIKFSLEKKLMTHGGKADDEANQLLKGIISLVLDTIASTRRIMINLRPAMIDDLGILATLNWYCREFEQVFTDIKIEKQINIEESEIPDHLKIVIFRIVQEGMNNIAKHSGANHVALTLEKINDFLALSIEDNGRGFDVENKTLESEIFQGFGIVNMEERARFSGGYFSINSWKEKGTFLKITWPLKPITLDHQLRIEPS